MANSSHGTGRNQRRNRTFFEEALSEMLHFMGRPVFAGTEPRDALGQMANSSHGTGRNRRRNRTFFEEALNEMLHFMGRPVFLIKIKIKRQDGMITAIARAFF